MTEPAFCCGMRRYFVLIPAKNPHETVEPPEVLDFVKLNLDGRPTLNTRYCPWCGKELDAGQTRRITQVTDR
jgi:hypothetical protein